MIEIFTSSCHVELNYRENDLNEITIVIQVNDRKYETVYEIIDRIHRAILPRFSSMEAKAASGRDDYFLAASAAAAAAFSASAFCSSFFFSFSALS